MSDKLSRACVYCGKDDVKISREHIVSRSVLIEIFGKNIENLVSTKLNEKWKHLLNHEAVKKDVCMNCNSQLSDYDMAGEEFVRKVQDEHNKQSVTLPFNKNTLGWLIKTHLNIIRNKQKTGNIALTVDRNIYNKLLDGTISSEDVKIMISASNLEPDFWRTDQRIVSAMEYHSGSIQANGNDLIFSRLRIKYLDISLIFPLDGARKSFDEDFYQGEIIILFTEPYKKSLDISRALSEGKIEISRNMSRDEFLKGLLPMDKYESLFS